MAIASGKVTATDPESELFAADPARTYIKIWNLGAATVFRRPQPQGGAAAVLNEGEPLGPLGANGIADFTVIEGNEARLAQRFLSDGADCVLSFISI